MHGTTHAFADATAPTIFPPQKFIYAQRKVSRSNGIDKKEDNKGG